MNDSRKPSAISVEYELKPCPFCSSQFLHLRKQKGKGWFIDCGDCGGNSGYHQTKETAVSFWNLRKFPITISGEFLKELIDSFLGMIILEEESVAVMGLEARSRIVYELLSVHGEQSGEPPIESREVFYPSDPESPPEFGGWENPTMAGAELVLASLSETQGIFTQIFEAVGEELQFQGITGVPRYPSLPGRILAIVQSANKIPGEFETHDSTALLRVLEVVALGVGTLMNFGIVRRGFTPDDFQEGKKEQ